MITPTNNDSSAVFALLTAISDPEAAKASLEEIMNAHSEYQKSIDIARLELKKANEDLAAKKTEVDTSLLEVQAIKADLDTSYANQGKQLKTLSEDLAYRQTALEAAEKDLRVRTSAIKAEEKLVTSREIDVSRLEDQAIKESSNAREMRELYASKLAALKALT